MAGPVHYEVFLRKTAPSPWSLLMATEDRQRAVDTAEDLLRDQRAVAVRVTKETLDPDTMEFASLTVLTKGVPEPPKKRVVDPAVAGPGCLNPTDLYTPQARDLINRVLEDWLHRNGVTGYELLHRPDLVEKLEASGVELQHAIQKIAIPESQATGQPSHELIRHYQRLVEGAMERVIAAGRRGLFDGLKDRSLAQVAEKLTGAPDRAFVIGGVLSQALAPIRGARARLDLLMDLADAAPPTGAAHALVMVAIEQILTEHLAPRTRLAEILGPALDQGACLAAIIRMVAPEEMEALIAASPQMALMLPTVDGPARRLGERLSAGEFPILSAALARTVVRELMGPRRLRPGDAVGEIAILRTLATALTSTVGRLLTLDEVQSAFAERSAGLITADFVAAYVEDCKTALAEAQALLRLCENVTGGGNKRSAARWLSACVGSLRFENEMRAAGPGPVQRLGVLAALQRGVRSVALSETDEAAILQTLGRIGGAIESEAKLTAALARSGAPVHQRLAVLLRMASGEATPLGPAADAAKAEAMRLFKAPQARAELGAAPETLTALRPLMKAAGLAA